MRVVHITCDLDPNSGGPTFAIKNLLQAQEIAGIEAEVMTGQGRVGLWSEDEGSSQRRKLTQSAKMRIRRTLESYDVVHIHGVWEPIQRFSLRTAIRLHKRVVWSPHGMLTRWAWRIGLVRLKKWLYFKHFLERYCNRPNLWMHFTSIAERDDSVRLIGLAKKQIIPLGIDCDQFDRGLSSQHEFMPTSKYSRSPIVLFLGRVHPRKGVEHLIRASSHIPKGSCQLWIVGPNHGVWAKQLINEQKAHADSCIEFRGAVDRHDLPKLFSTCDLFCLPSDHENFGMAAAEAAAAGLPCLLSSEVAISEQMAASGAASICRRDPIGLAEDIMALIRNPERRASLSERGKRYCRENFDNAVIAAQWRDFYSQPPSTNDLKL